MRDREAELLNTAESAQAQLNEGEARMRVLRGVRNTAVRALMSGDYDWTERTLAARLGLAGPRIHQIIEEKTR